jgi:alkylhydroperoxidase family enzyme
VKLTRAAATVEQADIDLLRGQGIGDTEISDAIQVVGYFNYITRVADGVGIEDEPEWPSLRNPLPGGARAGRPRGG